MRDFRLSIRPLAQQGKGSDLGPASSESRFSGAPNKSCGAVVSSSAAAPRAITLGMGARFESRPPRFLCGFRILQHLVKTVMFHEFRHQAVDRATSDTQFRFRYFP